MTSQINPSLPAQTTGPNKGKISTQNLREQLGHARDESNTHEAAIVQLQENSNDLVAALTELSQQTNDALSGKLDSEEASNFATLEQGEKADSAVQPQIMNEELSKKLDTSAADGFATSMQGQKADQAILYDAESGKGKLPDGTLIELGGATPPSILSVGSGSVTFGE